MTFISLVGPLPVLSGVGRRISWRGSGQRSSAGAALQLHAVQIIDKRRLSFQMSDF